MKHVAEGCFDPSSPGGRPGIWAATGRSGGSSLPPFDALNLADHVGDDPAAVLANRESVRTALGGTELAVMQACHGAAVAVVDTGGVLPAVDGLVTTRAGLVLLALAADCVPIALCDANGSVLAAAHCGWKGLVAGIVPATVAAMQDLGARGIRAVLGPSICPRCYPVDPARIAEVGTGVPAGVSSAALQVPGTIDVAAGVLAQLADLAVEAVRVPGCTAESVQLFSYRRDGVTGRQGIATMLVEQA